jgi:hypothetical protein
LLGILDLAFARIVACKFSELPTPEGAADRETHQRAK